MLNPREILFSEVGGHSMRQVSRSWFAGVLLVAVLLTGGTCTNARPSQSTQADPVQTENPLGSAGLEPASAGAVTVVKSYVEVLAAGGEADKFFIDSSRLRPRVDEVLNFVDGEVVQQTGDDAVVRYRYAVRPGTGGPVRLGIQWRVCGICPENGKSFTPTTIRRAKA